MPERFPTKTPEFVAGTTMYSGAPNTGQILNTNGGTHTYSKMSGVVGPDVNVWPGAGRLDGVYIHPSSDLALSGLPIVFYDSAVAVSGGPLSTSGHKIVGGVSCSPLTTLSSGVRNVGGYVPVGLVFTSGLCHSTASGQFGFSANFTPVVSG